VNARFVVPGAGVEDWRDCGSCSDCFVPAFNYRPKSSVQYIMALGSPGAGPDAEQVAAVVRAAGFDTAVSARIAEDRWLKLCVNLTSTPNALVRQDDHETRAFVEGKARLLEEARAVLAAEGIPARSCDGRDRSLDDEIAWQRGALARGDAARRLPLYNSVWQALRDDLPLETDDYHQRILALGERHAIPTPINARVLAALLRARAERLAPECCGAGELFGVWSCRALASIFHSSVSGRKAFQANQYASVTSTSSGASQRKTESSVE